MKLSRLIGEGFQGWLFSLPDSQQSLSAQITEFKKTVGLLGFGVCVFVCLLHERVVSVISCPRMQLWNFLIDFGVIFHYLPWNSLIKWKLEHK